MEKEQAAKGGHPSLAMTLTDPYKIRDLNVTVNLTHGRYADLRIELIGPDPDGTGGPALPLMIRLCDAGSLSGSGTKTLVFDDEGAGG